ncbi:DUF3299 domain-containing protein [Shimia sp.]|uniref:DUF3299 domain-containing protein n=1 Tax=Shimia sp. TaxID=1954381 RepID=UPI003B8EA049
MKPGYASATMALMAAVLAAPSFALEPRDIGWDELTGPTTQLENPFEDLSSDQMDTLAQILRLDMLAEDGIDTSSDGDASALRSDLKAQGIDADFLLEERLRIMAQLEKEASAANEDLVGENIRLPGYMLPLEMDGERAVEFLLVPTVGACIHVPPPPANQIIRVSYPEGFVADGFFTPIWITGELRNAPVQQSLYLVDGDTDVSVTYQLDATSVREYEF